MKKTRRLLLIFIIFSFFLMSCDDKNQAGLSAEDMVQACNIEVYEPVVLSHAKTELSNGTLINMYIELVEGSYNGYRSVPFERAWTGKFQITVKDKNHQVLSTTPLILDDEGISGFQNYFDLYIDDYNNDNNPDFTISYGFESGSLERYIIYSVLEDASVIELPVEGYLIVFSNHFSSISLDKLQPGGFSIYKPKRAVEGEDIAQSISYCWDGDQFTVESVQDYTAETPEAVQAHQNWSKKYFPDNAALQ